jgi:hypothetical protein
MPRQRAPNDDVEGILVTLRIPIWSKELDDRLNRCQEQRDAQKRLQGAQASASHMLETVEENYNYQPRQER